VLNFATTVVFSWTRLNSYGLRYLALTDLFGSFGGVLTLCLVVNSAVKNFVFDRLVAPVLSLLLALVIVFLFPPIHRDPNFDVLRNVATQLAQRAPEGVLLGGYWDTYVFAALEPRAHLIPVPAENQLVRTPWTPQIMKASPQVIVVHHVFPASTEIET